jgi:hypothetical protein
MTDNTQASEEVARRTPLELARQALTAGHREVTETLARKRADRDRLNAEIAGLRQQEADLARALKPYEKQPKATKLKAVTEPKAATEPPKAS